MSNVKRRLLALREAADTLSQLREEMPAYYAYIDLAVRRLRMIAERYEQQCQALAELQQAERKPPQRVTMSARRKQTTRVTLSNRTYPMQPLGRATPADPRDYDAEHEAEMRDQFGDDLPDGSD